MKCEERQKELFCCLLNIRKYVYGHQHLPVNESVLEKNPVLSGSGYDFPGECTCALLGSSLHFPAAGSKETVFHVWFHFWEEKLLNIKNMLL